MNTHISRGNDALRRGDYEAATDEFMKVVNDPDPLIQRIARHRLDEMYPERVYGSTHSFQRLYHRENCSARFKTRPWHLVWFGDWREAEASGYRPCSMCKPVRRSVMGVAL